METRTHPKLLALAAAALLAAPAAAQVPAPPPAAPAVNLPPIVDRPTGQRIPGKVIWFDLVTPDPARARPFYEGVLGWNFEERDGYPVARDGDVPVAGILRMPLPAPGEEAKPARWMPLVSVPDVARAAAAVRANGGRVLEGPGMLGARGRYVAVADPRGAQLVLVTAAGGDPADREAPPPGWMWAELWSDDLKVSTGFYRAVVGYESWKVGTGKQTTWILAAGGRPRARAAAMPFPKVTSHWLPYVLVKDLPGALSRVPALGGQVLRNPGGKGAQFAVITDPGGAAMVLEQRPEAPAGEVAQSPDAAPPPAAAEPDHDLYGLDDAERKAAQEAQQEALAEGAMAAPGGAAIVAPSPGVNLWIAPPAWGGYWGPGWWGYPPAWGGGYWWGPPPGWGYWNPYAPWRGGYGGYAPYGSYYRPGYRPPPGPAVGGPRPPGSGGYRPPAPPPGGKGSTGSPGVRSGGKSSGSRGSAAPPSRSGGSRPAPSRSGSGRH